MAEKALENLSFLQTFLVMFLMEEEKGRKNVQGEVIFHRITRLGLQGLLTACGGKARSKKDTRRPRSQALG